MINETRPFLIGCVSLTSKKIFSFDIFLLCRYFSVFAAIKIKQGRTTGSGKPTQTNELASIKYLARWYYAHFELAMKINRSRLPTETVGCRAVFFLLNQCKSIDPNMPTNNIHMLQGKPHFFENYKSERAKICYFEILHIHLRELDTLFGRTMITTPSQ